MTLSERLEALVEIAREAKGMTPTQAQIRMLLIREVGNAVVLMATGLALALFDRCIHG
jgi:hypothetical protein